MGLLNMFAKSYESLAQEQTKITNKMSELKKHSPEWKAKAKELDRVQYKMTDALLRGDAKGTPWNDGGI